MEKTGGRGRFGDTDNFFDKTNKYANGSNGLQAENLCSMTTGHPTALAAWNPAAHRIPHGTNARPEPTQAYDGAGRGLRTVEAFEAGSNRATFVCCAAAFLGDAAEAKGQADQRATHSM